MRGFKTACRAEALKGRHSSLPWLCLGLPVLVALMAALFFFLMPDSYRGAQSPLMAYELWNWWGILQPALLALVAGSVMRRDSREHLRPVLLLPLDPGVSFLAKTVIVLAWSQVANLVICLEGCLLPGLMGFGVTPPLSGLAACLLNVATTAWLIPLGLWGTAAVGPIFGMALPFLLEVGIGLSTWDTPIWWLLPPTASMNTTAPVLGVLPNGLPVEAGSDLAVFGLHSLCSLLIALVCFWVLTLTDSRWFSRREAV